MRATTWATLSASLMLGFGSTVLAVLAQAMSLARLTLFLPMLAALPGAPPRSLPAGEGMAGTGRFPASPQPDEEPFDATPVIAPMTTSIFSLSERAPCAAVAVEPLFRLHDGSYGGLRTVDWGQMPPALAARLEAVLIDRAVDRMGQSTETSGRETVIVSLAPSSLRSPLVHQRLQLVPADLPERPRLVLLARGGIPAATAAWALPGSRWRECVGLHLTEAPGSAEEVDGCDRLGLACVQIEAHLLHLDAPHGELAWRLLLRTVRAGTPVIVSNLVDPTLLADLRGQPWLFASGPLFSVQRAAA